MEILADLADINAHLPANVQIDNEVDTSLQVDAQRLIVGQLTGIFSPVVITSWDSPDNTPQIIRAIAGRLIASKYYARLLAGEAIDEIPGYSMDLYKDAVSQLIQIRNGTLIVVDGSNVPIAGVDIGSDPDGDVYPNDGAPGPAFTMDRIISST